MLLLGQALYGAFELLDAFLCSYCSFFDSFYRGFSAPQCLYNGTVGIALFPCPALRWRRRGWGVMLLALPGQIDRPERHSRVGSTVVVTLMASVLSSLSLGLSVLGRQKRSISAI